MCLGDWFDAETGIAFRIYADPVPNGMLVIRVLASDPSRVAIPNADVFKKGGA